MKHVNERTLSKYFDGELDVAESAVVEEHLKGCPRCHEAYEQLVSISEKLNVLPAAEPSPYFASRVKRAAAEARRAPLSSRILVPVAATAATLASLVIGGYLGQSIYSQWVGNETEAENGYADYFDVSPMEDYPEGSFGEVFTDLIPEEVSDEG
jgi:anti-sigma factor RsiW